MIEVKSLTKCYGSKIAIDSIDFHIEKGKILALLGPNGAGKTTTMRIMAGFLHPDAGTVVYDGVSVQENPKEIQTRLGYLPEHAPLYDDFLVSEFLEFISLAREIPEKIRNSSIEKVVSLCSLEKNFYRPIYQLSKGFKQRVALAATLIHDPEYIILDEPSSGLDPNQISDIRSLIRELGKQKTLILSTHILQEVKEVCDRVLILSKGKKVLDTPVLEIGTESYVLLSTKASLSQLNAIFEPKGIRGTVLLREHSDGFKDYQIPTPDGGIPKIFHALKETNEDVRCLMPYQKSLESVFHELTSGEE